MRITISERQVDKTEFINTRTRWHVHPRHSEEYWDGSPSLEIKYNAVDHHIDWVLMREGDRHVILSEQAWEARIEEILEHEDMTRDEAEDALDKQKVELIRLTRSCWGIDERVYVQMEEAWKALLQFVDVEYNVF